MTSIVKRLLPAPMHFWSADDLEESTFLLYAWVMELLPTKNFGACIRDYQQRSCSELVWDASTRDLLSEARNRLFTNFDIVRLKLATFKAIVLRIDTQLQAEMLFRQEGLPVDCADLYMYLLRDRGFWAILRQKMRVFNDPLLMQDMVLDYHRLLGECHSDFETYKINKNIKYLTYKKLQFVADSNNFDIKDLEQDIRLVAVSYYYKVRPFRSRLHAVNYAKSSVTGQIEQLRAYWTHEDRSRLRPETGSMKSYGNSVVISTGNLELLAGFENHSPDKLSWAEMVAA